jgi:hypothetical protein
MWVSRVLAVSCLGLAGCFAGLDDHLLTSGGGSANPPATGAEHDLGGAPQPTPSHEECDDFAGTAVGAVPAGWTVAGGTWKVVAVGATHALNQSAHATDPQTITTSAPADVEIAATVLADPTPPKVCLQGRFVDRLNHYSFCISGGNSWILYRMKAGAQTVLSMGSHTYAPAAAHVLSLKTKGSSLTASIDGTVLADVQDATFSTGVAALAANDSTNFSPVCLRPL